MQPRFKPVMHLSKTPKMMIIKNSPSPAMMSEPNPFTFTNYRTYLGFLAQKPAPTFEAGMPKSAASFRG